jgi:two-component system chemotaxis response regulator CheB
VASLVANIAIVVTGANDDGARGARKARDAGALVVVQRPEEASSPMMPRSAIAQSDPQVIASLTGISELMREAARVGHQ